MKEELHPIVDKALEAIGSLKSENALVFMQDFVEKMECCFQKGAKIMACGNGGSFADCLHFAEELTGFFSKERRALPAMVLGEAAHISCVSNDKGFAFVFSRMVEAFAQENDLLLVLSTSGNSRNVLEAARVARDRGVFVIGLLGRDGGELLNLCDQSFVVPGVRTSDRIQEVHMTILHIAIGMLEKRMFFPTPQKECFKDILFAR